MDWFEMRGRRDIVKNFKTGDLQQIEPPTAKVRVFDSVSFFNLDFHLCCSLIIFGQPHLFCIHPLGKTFLSGMIKSLVYATALFHHAHSFMTSCFRLSQ